MKLKYITFLLILLIGFAGCSNESDIPEVKSKHTLLVYMIANNSLDSYATNNIQSMIEGATKKNLNGGNLIIYYAPRGATPTLLEIKENANGVVTQNNVKDYSAQSAVDPDVMQHVIKDVASLYPADSYGLILWSHGTSWLPSDYQSKLKSFGQDGDNWMEIDELAKGLPDDFFDYILFDACYMASVECAFELKDKADYILASPTETMATGWPYQSMLPYFFTQTAQLEKIAELFYNYYNAQSGDYQTATVSLVQTSELDALASIVREIMADKTDNDIFALDRSLMQKLDFLPKGPYVVNPCMLYDLDDFIKQLATTEQYTRFAASLNKVVVYEAHTETAYFAALRQSYPIKNCSGLSVYTPQASLPKINAWYERLQWYKATSIRPATY